ncbi:alpha/beta hydrolase (plasmid) [Kovacikia minuta CCNUW1]|uniref:alpha/beta hydrolase n=1 Tax=Kovacikia minuta TaxID=2931930 RepID=UPI001CCABF3E|nr:alpha/beta hydrolase [Kovacikia minuta]UBF30029.1 alpha/beta hydrolase [Kovacikia minuta CCNUW1]
MLLTVLRRQSHLMQVNRLSGIKLLGSSLFLAVCASMSWGTSASAIETVTLVFNESRISVPFSDFQAFVQTGETQRQNLQEFIARTPNASQAARSVLTREIVITRPFSERNFRNPIADFLVLQLNKVLTPPTVPDNLEPLRTALVASYRDDQRISMLELLGNYPEREIVVQLPRLERAYNRANAFVERVQPALETAKTFLQDLVCDCPTAATSSSIKTSDEGVEGGSSAAAKSKSCP